MSTFSKALGVPPLFTLFLQGSISFLVLPDSVLLSNAAPLLIPLVAYMRFRKAVRPLV